MQAILVMFRSDGDRRSFSIARDMTVVGRREDCDLRIPLGEVSRKHCRLVRDGDSLRLEDLGSSNGTYLNGQRVQEATLSAGDSVQIGPVVFVLQVDGSPADEDLHPVSANMEDATGHSYAQGENGPLSPTAQSEVEDLIEGLDPLPEGHEHHHHSEEHAADIEGEPELNILGDLSEAEEGLELHGDDKAGESALELHSGAEVGEGDSGLELHSDAAEGEEGLELLDEDEHAGAPHPDDGEPLDLDDLTADSEHRPHT